MKHGEMPLLPVYTERVGSSSLSPPTIFPCTNCSCPLTTFAVPRGDRGVGIPENAEQLHAWAQMDRLIFRLAT